MRWLAKTFTGLLIAFALVGAGGYLLFISLVGAFTKLPPRPTYPNDDPQYAQQIKKAQAAKAKAKREATSKDAPKEPKPEATPSPTPKPLPPGAFEGRVTQPIGLVLRDAASLDSAQIGGIALNEKVIVLETSPDGNWQKVRLPNSNREGWVRAGNIEKNQ